MNRGMLLGERIRLRAVEPRDVDFIYQMENDPTTWQVGNTIVPYSRFQIEQYVLASDHDLYAERQLRLMIESLEPAGSRKVIGAIDLYDFDPHHQRAGIGILVINEEQKKGYATEALGLMIRYCFEVLNMHQLYCSIFPENHASIALFERSGFHRCGIYKEWRRSGDKWHDVIMFQLINPGIK